MSDEARAAAVAAIVADSADAWRPYADGAAAVFDVSTNLATGRG